MTTWKWEVRPSQSPHCLQNNSEQISALGSTCQLLSDGEWLCNFHVNRENHLPDSLFRVTQMKLLKDRFTSRGKKTKKPTKQKANRNVYFLIRQCQEWGEKRFLSLRRKSYHAKVGGVTLRQPYWCFKLSWTLCTPLLSRGVSAGGKVVGSEGSTYWRACVKAEAEVWAVMVASQDGIRPNVHLLWNCTGMKWLGLGNSWC